jgi:tetratricopeptide (TPR) repeat protein
MMINILKRPVIPAFFIFLLLTYSSVEANFDFNISCKTAYFQITSLKVLSARTLITTEKQQNPTNQIPVLLENYIDFLSIFVSEDQKQYELLRPSQKLRLLALEKDDKNSPYYLYSQAEINIQWAFVKIKFGDYVSAATDINSAYKLLVKNQLAHPHFIPNQKSLGLLHILIGSIPDQYKWVADIIGLDGNVNQGVRELKNAISLSKQNNEFSFLLPECAFLLAFVLSNLEADSKDLEQHYQLLTSLDTSNLLLFYSKARIANQLGKNDEVIGILTKYPKGKDYLPFPYLDYLLGKALLNKLDTKANIPFQNFIIHFKGRNYIKSAHHKIAWFHLIVKNDPLLYSKAMANVLITGNTVIGEDKEAQKEAETKSPPNFILLKSRLLFDGGYYLKAMQMLLDQSSVYFKPTKDELEFYYRLARINHKLENTAKAISLYETTIRNGENYPYYYAAYSAFMLGFIYEAQKNMEMAEYYFKKCISMKPHEYKETVDAKAKAALNRIKRK